MKIKLCGFSEEKSLKAAIDSNIDFIGFIFCDKSPRNISLQQAKSLEKLVPESIKKVAVTVNAELETLKDINNSLRPDFFQLHGQESIDYIKQVKENFPQIKIIKAFNIKDKSDFYNIKQYQYFVDYFLFDSKNPGSGKRFDWSLLEDVSLDKDYFLSGGLNIENISQAIEQTKAKMLDISSGIEIVKGKKSPQLITEIVNKIDKIKNA